MATKRLELIFKNQMEKTSKISIDEPKADLTDEEVQAVMNDMITKNIFSTSGGDLVSISGARVVTTDVQEYSVN